MFPTFARLNLDIAAAIQKALPKDVPPALKTGPGNLYQVLSRHANVENKIVHQIRWSEKGIGECWWSITRARFKDDGNHGKAWGYKYWRGVRVSPRAEQIRGGLKYKWIEGKSIGKPLTESS
ncbi:hypothetical protein BDZ89DRAFT_975217 [Hymenopellis radicata]|nr:hypothetical protein BDZ89DRAFT_975217 [Hymenopellis radicata]